MKFFKVFLFVSVFSIPVYFTVKFITHNQDKKWQTYYKSPEGVNVHRSTDREKKKARVVSEEKTKKHRIPASLPRARDYETKRIILGKIDKNTVYKNRPNPDWKKLYAQDILSKLSPESKVLIKKKSGMVRVIAGKATYIEQVQVSIHKDKDSPPNSFEAQVDAETGKQLSVWNRTNFEYGGNGFTLKKKLDP